MEPRAFDPRCHLMAHRQRVVAKSELFDSVWGDRFVSEAALTTALRTTRLVVRDTGHVLRAPTMEAHVSLIAS